MQNFLLGNKSPRERDFKYTAIQDNGITAKCITQGLILLSRDNAGIKTVGSLTTYGD